MPACIHQAVGVPQFSASAIFSHHGFQYRPCERFRSNDGSHSHDP